METDKIKYRLQYRLKYLFLKEVYEKQRKITQYDGQRIF